MCGQESEVVITALTRNPGNRRLASSITFAEYPFDIGPSRITTPSGCATSTTFQLFGIWTTPGASSRAEAAARVIGTSSTLFREASAIERRLSGTAGTVSGPLKTILSTCHT